MEPDREKPVEIQAFFCLGFDPTIRTLSALSMTPSLILRFRGKANESRSSRFNQTRTGENHGWRQSGRVLRRRGSSDLIHSNDPISQLGSLLLHAADGRFRLKNLIPVFAQDFDLILVDTGGKRHV